MSPITPSSEQVYEQRINAAMDFIAANLGEGLQLAQIAGAAGFSPFHFHRVFAAIVGETPHRFVARIRVERAAALLLDQTTQTVSEIGSSCGFATPSAFSRAFKANFGLTPSVWRHSGSRAVESANTNASSFSQRQSPAATVHELDPGRAWELECAGLRPASIEIAHLADIDVAYLRHTGPFAANPAVFASLFGRLGIWAEETEGVSAADETFALYHDDPTLTDDDRLRFSAAVRIDAGVAPMPPVSRSLIRGGRYAVARFTLGDADYSEAWTGMLGAWLPASGFEPDDRDYFERFPSLDSPSQTRIVDICLPVRPLRR